ncbi:MAG: hypothetical protein DI626_07510 [Micavibrio aeruginosavorus]|uniref:DUF1844 domain-containing protein n=1 Tax=Micavibrio aeruginosavorus TaxID=349221 RepID=A0A2W4ZYU6_9BACT|nr:MAG: hypothetical protein DI626_07510 [Micavibrio aeruginosavorus]
MFKTAFRQAEAADTRLEIRRDEKNEHGHSEEHEEKEDTSALWEDKTTVSVEALKAFLIAFLKEKGVAEDHAAISAAATQQSTLPQKPLTTVATRAVKAYTALAPQTPPPPVSEPLTENIPLADQLKNDELRTMHILIRELDILAARGVHDLTIEKADTFLNALVLAVEKAKSGT